MGIITKEVELKFNYLKHKVRKYYTDLGYIKNEDDIIKVKTEDLTFGSGQKIEVECDECGKKYFIPYNCYTRYNHNGLIYCNNCVNAVLHSGKIITNGIQIKRMKKELLNEDIKDIKNL